LRITFNEALAMEILLKLRHYFISVTELHSFVVVLENTNIKRLFWDCLACIGTVLDYFGISLGCIRTLLGCFRTVFSWIRTEVACIGTVVAFNGNVLPVLRLNWLV